MQHVVVSFTSDDGGDILQRRRHRLHSGSRQIPLTLLSLPFEQRRRASREA